MFPERPEDILRDPVTLEPISDLAGLMRDGFYDLRVGGLSRKNEKEIEHFRKTYKPLSPEEKCYAYKIKILPAPETTRATKILDMGCGPYDCISAIPGQHFFLDDLMDLYCSDLGVRSDGMRICARTELMPFCDDAFDVIYSINMIDHVDDMPETVHEMFRVLKPEGRLYLQSYFNSHPLLETEPGVYDVHFEKEYIRPYFDVLEHQTYAMGDPKISPSYTMDIVACVLRKKKDLPSAAFVRKPRERYQSPGYQGPQSLISEALGALREGRSMDAQNAIDALRGEPYYRLQMRMLEVMVAIAAGDFDEAGHEIGELSKDERVRRNPFARIALLELSNKRIAEALNRMRLQAPPPSGRQRVRAVAGRAYALAERILKGPAR